MQNTGDFDVVEIAAIARQQAVVFGARYRLVEVTKRLLRHQSSPCASAAPRAESPARCSDSPYSGTDCPTAPRAPAPPMATGSRASTLRMSSRYPACRNRTANRDTHAAPAGAARDGRLAR